MSARNRWYLSSQMIATLWLGMLLGVSGLATPVKFMAPSLSLPAALDVGRHTFAAFNRVEWLMAALLLLALWRSRACAGAGAWAIAVALAALLLGETAALLPALDQRVEIILHGGVPEPSRLHRLYVVAEATKAVLLGAMAVVAVRGLTGDRTAHGKLPDAPEPVRFQR
jgi:hypothetical protein